MEGLNVYKSTVGSMHFRAVIMVEQVKLFRAATENAMGGLVACKSGSLPLAKRPIFISYNHTLQHMRSPNFARAVCAR